MVYCNAIIEVKMLHTFNEDCLSRYESWFILKDGRNVFIRPILPADERPIVDLFNKLHCDSVYMRFLTHLKALPEDLLFQVLVDEGVDLALPIAEETITGKTVFFVDGNALAACFDSGITDELVQLIAKRKPLRAVFRDSSYGSDSVKINVDQIFRLLSPETEVRSI